MSEAAAPKRTRKPKAAPVEAREPAPNTEPTADAAPEPVAPEPVAPEPAAPAPASDPEADGRPGTQPGELVLALSPRQIVGGFALLAALIVLARRRGKKGR